MAITENTLNRLFHKINRECFNGELKKIPVVFKRTFSHSRTQWYTNQYNKGARSNEAALKVTRGKAVMIKIDPRHKEGINVKDSGRHFTYPYSPNAPWMTVTEILVHEMLHCHQLVKLGQNKMTACAHTDYFHRKVARLSRKMGVKHPVSGWFFK